MNHVPTPELDRRAEVMPQAETLTEFVDWLAADGLSICWLDRRAYCGGLGLKYDCEDGTLVRSHSYHPGRTETDRSGETCPTCEGKGWVEGPGSYEPITESFESLFARFFGLNLDLIEQERQALLDALREDL